MLFTGKNFDLPKDHKPFLKGVKGGFSCANCKYLRPNHQCASEEYQEWNGSNKLPPGDLEEMCSDWFQAGEHKKRSLGEQLREQKRDK